MSIEPKSEARFAVEPLVAQILKMDEGPLKLAMLLLLRRFPAAKEIRAKRADEHIAWLFQVDDNPTLFWLNAKGELSEALA